MNGKSLILRHHDLFKPYAYKSFLAGLHDNENSNNRHDNGVLIQPQCQKRGISIAVARVSCDFGILLLLLLLLLLLQLLLRYVPTNRLLILFLPDHTL